MTKLFPIITLHHKLCITTCCIIMLQLGSKYQVTDLSICGKQINLEIKTIESKQKKREESRILNESIWATTRCPGKTVKHHLHTNFALTR